MIFILIAESPQVIRFLVLGAVLFYSIQRARKISMDIQMYEKLWEGSI